MASAFAIHMLHPTIHMLKRPCGARIPNVALGYHAALGFSDALGLGTLIENVSPVILSACAVLLTIAQLPANGVGVLLNAGYCVMVCRKCTEDESEHDMTHELPSVDEYLERIGIEQPKAPTTEFLDELIDAHQHAVPFDNLDVYAKGLTPSLEVADLFDKMVRRKRGGYCFELNGLFGALLRALGYEVQPAMARVTLRPIPHPLITHRANIVTIDGKRYLADVGFGGPMPNFAPLVEDGATRTEGGHTFTLHERDAYWWEVGYRGSKEEERIVLRVCTMPVGEEDFIPLSFFQANNPESVFKLNRMANIKTADGAYDLRNNTYTEFHGAEKTVTEIAEADIPALLKEKFGIVL